MLRRFVILLLLWSIHTFTVVVTLNSLPVAYNGVEPSLDGCTVSADSDEGRASCSGVTVLSDGDIGSVDISDPDQVHRFLVWHQSSQTFSITLHFVAGTNLFHVDIYTLNKHTERIGLPLKPTVTAFNHEGHPSSATRAESCIYASDENSIMKTALEVATVERVVVEFMFSETSDVEWIFLSEIQLCHEEPGLPISCETLIDSTPFEITLSSPPPTGVTVTPDLSQPDSVSLTCSVASPRPPTDGYQYQWQWLKSGTLLTSSDTPFTITHTTNTQSSSLQISGLRYSDAGEYMCRVNYTLCPDTVDCSEATPVTGNIELSLPGNVYV